MTYQIRSGPTNFDLEAASTKRKQSIADALLQSALSEKSNGEMIGKHYVGKGLTNAVGSIIDALLSKNMSASAKEEGASTAERKQAALQEELASYMTQQQGTPAKAIPYSGDQIMEMMQNDTELPPQGMTEAVAPDRRAAAVKAVASQFPQLQALGQMDMQELTRQQKPVQEEWRDPVAFERNGQSGLMMTSKAGNTKVLEGFAPLKKEPLVKIDNKVGDNALKGVTDSGIKRLEESYTGAKAALTSFEVINQLRPMINQVQTGTGSDYIIGMKKIASALGYPDDGSISTTEQMSAALGRAILDNAKALGINPTDYDAKKIEKIVEAGGTLDLPTVKHAVNAMTAASINKVRSHDKLVNDLEGQGELGFNSGVLKTFKLGVPGFEGLSPEEFNYDPETMRFSAKPFRSGESPSEVQAARKAPATTEPGMLTAAELLAKRRGGQ